MAGKLEASPVKSRLTALIVAGVVASAMLVPAAAFAVEPSVGEQTGKGMTDVTIQVKTPGEVGGNTDPDNPPSDPDDPDSVGKNIAFTVPSAINFVADAQGKLTGPSATAAYIENESQFSIHASSFDIDAENDWTIIEDGTEATADNSADFQFGPADAKIDAGAYLTKKAIPAADASKWNMGTAASQGTSDRVGLASSGNIFKVKQDITSQKKIATIKTYVKAGEA